MPEKWRESSVGMAMAPVGQILGLVVLCLAIYRLYNTPFLPATHSTHHQRRSAAPTSIEDDAFRAKCLAFKPSYLNAAHELTEFQSAGGTFDLAHRPSTCGGPGQSEILNNDVCRVALYVPTSSRSGSHVEVWMPKTWSGRFLGTGNGGLNGCLDYASLTYGTSNGFAAVAANNGHNGTSGLPFYRNRDVLHDFADRSMHSRVVVGKAVIKQFYGREHTKAYFIGCSQGGRQGIASAVKNPRDFDGIVAGAPALDFNALVAWRAGFFAITGREGGSEFIRPEVWRGLVHEEVLRQCDGVLDGVADGVVEYPDLCDFDPGTLLCDGKRQGGRQCLSEAQVEQVRTIFAPFRQVDGTLIYPGMLPGSEKRAVERLYAGKPFSDSEDWFRYVVYNDASWDPATFTVADAAVAQALDPFQIKTFPSPNDLEEFQVGGGKLLVYHGMQDQQITALNTDRWFEYLRSCETQESLDEWVRYFRVSGLYHCTGGEGAWKVGQTGGITTYEPQKNVLAAIVDWVENGNAPEVIEGANGVSTDGSAGEVGVTSYTRRHCRYPKRNQYIGRKVDAGGGLPSSSSVNDWICA